LGHSVLVSHFLYGNLGFIFEDAPIGLYMKNSDKIKPTLPWDLACPPPENKKITSPPTSYVPVYYGSLTKQPKYTELPTWFVKEMHQVYVEHKNPTVTRQFELLYKGMDMGNKNSFITSFEDAKGEVQHKIDFIKLKDKFIHDYYGDCFLSKSIEVYEKHQKTLKEQGVIVPLDIQVSNWKLLHQLAETQHTLEFLSVHAHLFSKSQNSNNILIIQENPNSKCDVTVVNPNGSVTYYDVTHINPNDLYYERNLQDKLAKDKSTIILLTYPDIHPPKYQNHPRVEILDPNAFQNLAQKIGITVEDRQVSERKDISFPLINGSFVIPVDHFKEIYDKNIDKK
jgi:hypothetical protein